MLWAFKVVLHVYPGYMTAVNRHNALFALPADLTRPEQLQPVAGEQLLVLVGEWERTREARASVTLATMQPEDGAFRVVEAATQMGLCSMPTTQQLQRMKQQLQEAVAEDKQTGRRQGLDFDAMLADPQLQQTREALWSDPDFVSEWNAMQEEFADMGPPPDWLTALGEEDAGERGYNTMEDLIHMMKV